MKTYRSFQNNTRIIFFLVICSIFLPAIHAQVAKPPLELIKNVADKIIRETSFDFHWRTLEYNGGISLINLNETSIPENEAIYIYGRVFASRKLNTTLSLACNGDIKIYLNGLLLTHSKNEKYHFREYTYNHYSFNLNLPVTYVKGTNELLICLYNSQPGPTLPVQISELNKTSEIYLEPVPGNGPGFDWLLCGPIGTIEQQHFQRPEYLGFKPGYGTGTTYNTWRIAAPLLVREFNISPDNSFQRDSYADWHYANGNTMMAIYNLYELTGYNKYRDILIHSMNAFLFNYSYFSHQYNQLNVVRGAYHRFFRMAMLDDSGGPALSYAEFRKKEKNIQNDSILLVALRYVLEKQERLSDGTFSRPEPEEGTIWADDLFMSSPFLLRMAEITNDNSIYDEVAKQIVQFNKYLSDKKNGLYYHGWYDQRKEHAPVQWARANGWVIWAETEALLYIPEKNPQYPEIKKIYKNHIDALIRVQNDNGMWNQVLNVPETYDETSATAMFTLAIARGVNEGWLNSNYKKYAIKGWQAIAKQIGSDGTVSGICRGTGIGNDVEFYQDRQTFDHDPRGLGAVITAGIEIHKLIQNKTK